MCTQRDRSPENTRALQRRKCNRRGILTGEILGYRRRAIGTTDWQSQTVGVWIFRLNNLACAACMPRGLHVLLMFIEKSRYLRHG